ncbi:MAG: DNA-processing protein DprA [Porticoccaceae bacterium]
MDSEILNPNLNSDDEAHWGLITQLLPECNSALQLKLLGELHSFCALLDGQQTMTDNALDQQLQRLRQQYRRGDWQSQYTAINRALTAADAQVIPITGEDYPPQLQQIAKPPPLLYLRGSLESLHLPQLAVVGSRRMTKGGENHARSWATYLAANGFTITSGLALGIDGAAHRGALESPNGKTIAVMATGIDRRYPARHVQLAEQIVQRGGALVTEFPPGTQPRPSHFPQRNRIISGLSLGVLVVEAAVKSGSLITAKYALEQNREVFAIPGSINNPQSKGCHQLIKQGATLVESVDEIVHELHGPLGALREQVPSPELSEPLPELSDEEAQLLAQMGYDPILIDDICSPWPMDKLSQLLVSLELKGVISNQQGYFQRML